MLRFVHINRHTNGNYYYSCNYSSSTTSSTVVVNFNHQRSYNMCDYNSRHCGGNIISYYRKYSDNIKINHHHTTTSTVPIKQSSTTTMYDGHRFRIRVMCYLWNHRTGSVVTNDDNDTIVRLLHQQQHQRRRSSLQQKPMVQWNNVDECNVSSISTLAFYNNKTNSNNQTTQQGSRFFDCYNPFVTLPSRIIFHRHEQRQHQQWNDTRYTTGSYNSIRYIRTTSTPINDKDDDTQVATTTTNRNPNNANTTFQARVGDDNKDDTVSQQNHFIQQQQQPLDAINQQPQLQQKQSFTVVLQHWLQQLRAIPNIITVSRIILIPFISYWIMTHQTILAFIGCIYAAISDVLDGSIARRFPTMQTPLGTYLDPLADKLFINALSISLWMNGTLPTTLVGLWFVRDVILMIATHQYVAQNTSPGMTVMDPVTVPIQVIPTTISKINTGLQFITLVVGIIAVSPIEMSTIDTLSEAYSTATAVVDHDITNSLNWYDMERFFVQRMYITNHILPTLCWITGATTIGSSLSYYGHSAFIATTVTNDTVGNKPRRPPQK